MQRFQGYRSLMLESRNEILPLGAFSPMGKKQSAYLDSLLELNAEAVATQAAECAANRLSNIPGNYRIILVVLDEAKNGWTQRFLTDAEWRFDEKYDIVPSRQNLGVWITVQLWTDVKATMGYVAYETKASIFRAIHRSRLGCPANLEEMIVQEGRAAVFGGKPSELSRDQLFEANKKVEPYAHCTDKGTCIAVLYGDKIAHTLGYTPLGFTDFFGFEAGLANAHLASDITSELIKCA